MSVWKSDEKLLSICILNFSFKNDFVWEEISNIRHSVSSPDGTPRSSSKILRCASYFQLSSRCFIWWWNTASHVWYITSNNRIKRENSLCKSANLKSRTLWWWSKWIAKSGWQIRPLKKSVMFKHWTNDFVGGWMEDTLRRATRIRALPRVAQTERKMFKTARNRFICCCIRAVCHWLSSWSHLFSSFREKEHRLKQRSPSSAAKELNFTRPKQRLEVSASYIVNINLHRQTGLEFK